MRSPVICSPFWFLNAFPSAVMMLAGLDEEAVVCDAAGVSAGAGVCEVDAAAGVEALDCCCSAIFSSLFWSKKSKLSKEESSVGSFVYRPAGGCIPWSHGSVSQ